MSTTTAGAGFNVSIAVSNTGSVVSDVVVLVFGSLAGSNDCPLRTLMGFERLAAVRVGAKVGVGIYIDPRTLGCVNDAGVRMLPAGSLSLEAGDIASPATHNMTLTGRDLVMPA